MANNLRIETVDIENPDGLNFILGHAHFIQTVDDLAEVCARHSIPAFGERRSAETTAGYCVAQIHHHLLSRRRSHPLFL
jgi:hypothetical protein